MRILVANEALAGAGGVETYLGSIVLQDLAWRVEKGAGGKFRVVAHASDAPVTFGPYADKASLKRELKADILVPARTSVKTNGKGVLQDPNFRLALKNTFKYTFGTEIIKLLLGVPCALILNRRFGGRRLLRFGRGGGCGDLGSRAGRHPGHRRPGGRRRRRASARSRTACGARLAA